MAIKVKTKKAEPEAVKTTKLTMIAAAQPAAMASNALMVEDEFNPFYMTGANSNSGHLLRPPYDPRQLERLTQENNAIGACIDAMIVNIDGTGFKIEKEDAKSTDVDEEEDPKAKALEDFFKEPFPGVSFMTMRRELRRDMERIGFGFLEVMRNVTGDIVFIRNVPARTIRMVKLDGAVPVKKKVMRNGVEMEFDVMVRERRFVQLMAGQLLYFREFGSSRDCNKNTGDWAGKDKPVNANDRATELMYFQVGSDPNSPYGVPRWEGAIPSLLGSRSSEENNLTYLQSGGLPPALVIVQGGVMAGETRQALERQFSPGQKNRAAILEIPSSDGSLDKPGGVKVSVERFGWEKSNDAMFQSYDDKCFEKIARQFRIAPLFVGKTDSMNFATAQVGYMVAEAQVFGPERNHFDEQISRKLLPALGGKGYVLKSKPITLKDVETQVRGLTLLAAMPGADVESLVEQTNLVTGVDVQFSQEQIDRDNEMKQQEHEANLQAALIAAKNQPAGMPGAPGQPGGPGKAPFAPKAGPAAGKPGQKPVPGRKPIPGAKPAPGGKAPVVKKTDVVQSIAQDLAERAYAAMRLSKVDELANVLDEAALLDEAENQEFRRAVATRQFLSVSADPEGLADIAGCTAAIMKG